MKKIICMVGLILIHLTGPVNADEWIINDSYIGGDYKNNYARNDGDVISTKKQYDNYNTEAMTVNIDDTGKVEITINTGYSTGIDGTFDGTQYGDLFISTDGWQPFGNSGDNYNTDNHSNGTSWEYVFDTSASTIYKIESQDQILLSDDPTFTNGSNWVDGTNVTGELYNGSPDPADTELYSWYRHNQEIWFDNTDGTDTGDGIFSDADSGIGGFLTYSFDLSSLGITPKQGYDLGLHWAMTCGNDVIEGGLSKSAVPEPGTLVLLGLGVLGLGILRQKKTY